MQDKTLIGSEEWCSFPQLGIPAIKARVDSGAKTSALHAINIKVFDKNGEDGAPILIFKLLFRCSFQKNK